MSSGALVDWQPFELGCDEAVEYPVQLHGLLKLSVRVVLAELGKQVDLQCMTIRHANVHNQCLMARIVNPNDTLLAAIEVHEAGKIEIRMHKNMGGVKKTIRVLCAVDIHGYAECKLDIYEQAIHLLQEEIHGNFGRLFTYGYVHQALSCLLHQLEQLPEEQDALEPPTLMDPEDFGPVVETPPADGMSRKRGRDADDDSEGAWPQRPRGY